MGDNISRRAVLNWLENEWDGKVTSLFAGIEQLPSTELIHCRDCRWWDKYSDDMGYCMAAKHGHFSRHWEISIRRTYESDFYCADGERGEQDA